MFNASVASPATRMALLIATAAMAFANPAVAQVPAPPASPLPVVSLEYDANGNFTKATKAGLATTNSYDSLNRRSQAIDARSKTTRFSYTGQDDLSQVTDPRNLVTRYPRNGFGDATGLISPDTGTQNFTLDAAGNLLTRIDARGVSDTYGYDPLNRLKSVVYNQSGQPTQSILWGYDQTGPGFSNGIGRLTSTQFAWPGLYSGWATYAYDAKGRLLNTVQSVSSPGSSATLSTGYGYDAAGHVVSITYPSGRVLNIPHSGGQPLGMSLTAAGGGTTSSLLTDLQFEPGPGGQGPARSWNWQLDSGTLAHARVFDSVGRMVRHPLGGAVRDISYDAADRIIGYTHWNAISGSPVAALDQGFGYDEVDRLTTVTTSVGSWSIGYDDNGNRTVVVQNTVNGAVTRNFTTDVASNRLLALDNPPRTFSPDAAGNVVADNTAGLSTAMLIDPSGRIARFDASNGTRSTSVSYGYDAFGHRVLKYNAATQTLDCRPTPAQLCSSSQWAVASNVYVHDQSGHLLGEYNLKGGVIREYVWLQDILVSVIDGTGSSPIIAYVQSDHLDTPRTVIDRAGRQRWTWISEPFGNSAPIENPLGFGAFRLNLRMPGQYHDVESGLEYNWNRTYDSGLGRYTQSDPLGIAASINT